MVALLAAIAAGVLFSPGAGAAPGDLDPAFSGDGRQQTDFGLGDSVASAAAIQPDGKIVAAGATGPHRGPRLASFAIARYDSDGSPDPSFSDDGRQVTDFGGRGSAAFGVAIQGDGKIVAAGSADGDFALARYNPDGSLDPTFSGDGRQTGDLGGSDRAGAVALQADGKIVAVGTTTPNDGGRQLALARYNPDGSLDTSFSGDGRQTGDFRGRGEAVAIQGNSKIVVAGEYYPAGSEWTAFALARYNPDGSLDTTFSGDGVETTHFGIYGGAQAVALQPDGRIVAAGATADYSGSRFALARYDPDGSLDTTFSDDGKQTTSFGGAYAGAHGVAIQADAKIVAVGWRGEISPSADFAVARYDSDGSLDPTFSGDGMETTDLGGYDIAEAVALQPDGKIVAVGGRGEFAVARYDPDGSLDPSFSGDGVLRTSFAGFDAAQGVAIQADGKFVAAGTALDRDGNYLVAVARYDPDGSLDPTFSGDGVLTANPFGGARPGGARAVAIQADGKIVVVGGAWHAFGLARYNPDGSLDPALSGDGVQTTTFEEGNRIWAQAVAIQPDGKIVAVGGAGAGASGSQGDFAIARYNSDGSLDETFSDDGMQTTDLGKFDRATAVALQPDGKIVVAGGAHGDFALVRYDADGSLDETFSGSGKQTTDFGAGDRATGVAIQPDGRIVAVGGGNFDLARYDPDGSLDPTFSGDGLQTTDLGGFDYAGAVALQADGKIVAAGGAGGDFALARYATDGSLDPTFSGDGVQTTDLGGPDAGHGVALEADGDVVVVGRGIGTDQTLDFALARYLGS